MLASNNGCLAIIRAEHLVMETDNCQTDIVDQLESRSSEWTDFVFKSQTVHVIHVAIAVEQIALQSGTGRLHTDTQTHRQTDKQTHCDAVCIHTDALWQIYSGQ